MTSDIILQYEVIFTSRVVLNKMFQKSRVLTLVDDSQGRISVGFAL